MILKDITKEIRIVYESTNNDITFVLNGIFNIVSNPTWNNDAIKFWNDFTFVDTKNFTKL